MRYRHLFYLYAIVLVLCLAQVIRGEEDHSGKAGAPGSGTPNTTTRPVAPEALPADIVQFLQKWINPSEAYLKSQFKITPTLNMGLAAALEKSIQSKDEAATGKIMAEFLGQLGDEQLKALQTALPLPTIACGTDQDAANVSRLQALRDRMAIVSRRVKQLVTDPPQPTCEVPLKNRIVAAFDAAWPDTLAHNQKYHALKKKIDEEQDPEKRKQAQTELAALIDSPAASGFARQQVLSNGEAGKKNAAELAAAFAEKLNGEYFTTVDHSGGGSARIGLGNRDQLVASTTELVQDPEFLKTALTVQRRPNARQVRTRAAGGSGIQLAPTTTTQGAAATPTPTPVPTATPTPTGGANPNPPVTNTPGAETAAKLVMSGKCGSCHGPGGSRVTTPAGVPKTGDDLLRLTSSGQLADASGNAIPASSPAYRTWIQATFDRVFKEADMPPASRPQPSDTERQNLRAWLLSQGATP